MQRVRFEVPVATGGASETTAEYVVAAEANDAAVPSFDLIAALVLYCSYMC